MDKSAQVAGVAEQQVEQLPPTQLPPTQQAEQALNEGDVAEAEKLLRSLLISHPDEPKTQLLSAKLSLAKRNFRSALETIDGVSQSNNATEQDVSAGYAIISDIALKSLDSLSSHPRLAWVGIESELKSQPQNHNLRKALVRLLNRMGHRHRACQHSDWLCAVGVADEEQLLGLLARRDSHPTKESSSEAQAEETKHYTVLADARRHFTAHRFKQAVKALRPAFESEWPDSEHAAVFGESLAQTQDFGSMPRWHESCPRGVSQYAEYWSAMGLWYGSLSKFRAAAGCFLAAIEIDPTHLNDYRQLLFCVRQLGSQDQAKLASRISQTSQQVQNTFAQAGIANAVDDASSTDDAAADSNKAKTSKLQRAKYLSGMSQTLNALGRPQEFIAWQVLLNQAAGAPQARIAKLRQQQRQLAQIPDLKKMSVQDRRMGLQPADYPRPTTKQINELLASAKRGTIAKPRVALDAPSESGLALHDVSQQANLRFQYQNHVTPKERGFRIHESMGGGIAVIDFDLDGHPDLYFNQGAGDPPEIRATRSNELHRNLGRQFVNVDQASQTMDFGYSTGVASGDVNQDGLPDLFVGSLGRNRLFINQGDGTFTEAKYQLRPTTPETSPRYTSSVAIADVTGDHLPDLIEANYVGGNRIAPNSSIFDTRPVDDGQIPAGTSPRDYPPAGDRVFVSLADGTFSETELETEGRDAAASLGLIVTNINESQGNEIFIANDAYPNRFWVQRETSTADVAKRHRFVDQAAAFGLAVDYSRTETAGMGVAAGDFDSNGLIDLHVTNFWEQSSTLYMQQSSGLFLDQAPRHGLESLTYSMLGFGTQAADFDHDGRLDLAILNGHIEDYRIIGHPFRMKPQLLLGTGGEFQDSEVKPTVYFQQPQLGRSLAVLDWNSDGKSDLIAGDLTAPVSLLENATESENHWLQIHLVGTVSARDAIGAKITIRSGGQTWVDWAIAGNGYQCSSERTITVGLGNLSLANGQQLDQVTLTWPSGKIETLKSLQVDRAYIAIEAIGTFLDRAD